MYRCQFSAIRLYLASVSLLFACSYIELHPLKQKGIRPIKAVINKISTAVTRQAAGNPTEKFFPQWSGTVLSRDYLSGHEFVFLKAGEQGCPTPIFPGLNLIASVDLGQVPSAQVLYPDTELPQLLVWTFLSELCLSTCHSWL